MSKKRSDDRVEDYDSFRDEPDVNRDSKKLFGSTWNMFVKRGEPHMKARLLCRIGSIALVPGVSLEFIDHIIISSQALVETANDLTALGIGSYAIGGLIAVADMVSDNNRVNRPKDQ